MALEGMWYNLTDINSSSVLGFTQGVNTVLVNGMLGIILIIMLFFISFLSMNYYWRDKWFNLNSSLLFVAILSMLFVPLELVPYFLPLLLFTLFVFSLIAMMLTYR